MRFVSTSQRRSPSSAANFSQCTPSARTSRTPRGGAARDTARATTSQLFTAIRRLPLIERRLVDRWYFATGNTFWYMSGDRGYAPLEARAAELIATLPDGLDVSAAVEVADESGFPGLGAQPYGVDGLRQTFTGGAIIWTPATGAAPTSRSPAAAARAGNGYPGQK